MQVKGQIRLDFALLCNYHERRNGPACLAWIGSPIPDGLICFTAAKGGHNLLGSLICKVPIAATTLVLGLAAEACSTDTQEPISPARVDYRLFHFISGRRVRLRRRVHGIRPPARRQRATASPSPSRDSTNTASSIAVSNLPNHRTRRRWSSSDILP